MTPASPDTDELLRRSQAGDGNARGALLDRHRRRELAAALDSAG